MLTSKRFVVVGHPRSGSTYLTYRIALGVDAYTPNVRQEELFNVYECRFNCCVLGLDGSTEVSIMEGFFAQADRPFSGFKTIPSFHREWQAIVNLPGIQFITIQRDDFLSCLASTIVSERKFQWDRQAREQLAGERLWFSKLYPDRREIEVRLGEVLNRLLFDYRSLERLNQRETTIAINAESLLDPRWRSERIDAYFGQPVGLGGFRRPTDYRECFHDAEEYRAATAALMHRFLQNDTFIPQPIAHFLAEN